jgi:hypothetical protein
MRPNGAARTLHPEPDLQTLLKAVATVFTLYLTLGSRHVVRIKRSYLDLIGCDCIP